MMNITSSAFAAMGTMCRVAVLGDGAEKYVQLATARTEDLEQKWSRFRPSSELRRLCDAAPVTQVVSDDTYLLLDRGVYAWRATNGLFDPSICALMVASGYDRSFESVPRRRRATPLELSAAPGCGGIMLSAIDKSVTMPPGIGFDPGGIGKGLAADLVTESLLESGARGVCVDIGGDIRVGGEWPDDGWAIGIANPFDDDDLVSIVLVADHGIATSNRAARTWIVGNEQRNHLLVPSTSRCASGPLSASVIAGEAWWAEVLAKMAMLDPGTARRKIPLLGGVALTIGADKSVATIGDYARYEQPRLRRDARISS